jgi:menaquinone-dependent protoporphyrinogen oxidase
MNTLIIYATVEGQTEKIAQFAKKRISEGGHEVSLINADDPEQISFDGVDAVILAASVHQRRHPRNFEALLVAHKADLEKRRTLLLSVSLNAAFPEGLEEAQDYVDEMKMRTGFEPTGELLVPGAVRISEYDFFAMQVVRYVVLRNRDYDPGEGTHEFTDWEALSDRLESFLA